MLRKTTIANLQSSFNGNRPILPSFKIMQTTTCGWSLIVVVFCSHDELIREQAYHNSLLTTILHKTKLFHLAIYFFKELNWVPANLKVPDLWSTCLLVQKSYLERGSYKVCLDIICICSNIEIRTNHCLSLSFTEQEIARVNEFVGPSQWFMDIWMGWVFIP